MSETLNKLGLATLMCKGNVYVKRKAIERFRKDDSKRILLLSSKHAASGLDLIEANEILFIDPVYAEHDVKDSIEQQAMGRAHRVGQTKPVKIVKFLIRDTIEETSYKKFLKKKEEKLIKLGIKSEESFWKDEPKEPDTKKIKTI